MKLFAVLLLMLVAFAHNSSVVESASAAPVCPSSPARFSEKPPFPTTQPRTEIRIAHLLIHRLKDGTASGSHLHAAQIQPHERC